MRFALETPGTARWTTSQGREYRSDEQRPKNNPNRQGGSMSICSTTHVYHYMFNSDQDVIASILETGLRPLSDFPESERWQQIEKIYPGVFEHLYELFAQPVIHKPYTNSGVFVSPIDFRQMPESFMFTKPRAVIPTNRFAPEWSALTYEYEGQRISLPLTEENLIRTAELWTTEQVQKWFGLDQRRLFFYVPQIVTYQPGGIKVYLEDLED
jgi:hypothetical protein